MLRFFGALSWILAFTSGAVLLAVSTARREARGGKERFLLSLSAMFVAATQVVIRQADPFGTQGAGNVMYQSFIVPAINAASYLGFFSFLEGADRFQSAAADTRASGIDCVLSGLSLFLCLAASAFHIAVLAAEPEVPRILVIGLSASWAGFTGLAALRLVLKTVSAARSRRRGRFIASALASASFLGFSFVEILPQFLPGAPDSVDPEYVILPLFVAFITGWATKDLVSERGVKGESAGQAVRMLSGREAEVARLLIKGLSYQETAEALCVSLSTIQSHVVAIYGKLGVSNKVQLANKLRDGP